MASNFAEQYKLLFGKDLNFDPIKPGVPQVAPSPRMSVSALGVGGEVPTEAGPAYASLPEPPAPEPPGYGGALARQLGAGVADLGSMVLGAPEYLARQTALTHESAGVRGAARTVTDVLQTGRQGLDAKAQEWVSQMSPEHQDAANRLIFTLDPTQTIFQGGPTEAAGAIGLKLARMAPPSLATLLGGGLLLRAGLTVAGAAYMGASEAVMTVGDVQNTVANEIANTPEEQLMADSPAYAQMIQSGLDPMTARRNLTAQAQGAAPVIAGLTVGAISSVTGRLMTPIFREGTGNIVQRFGKGYMTEMPQEASQGGAQQIAQNIAAQVYDQDRTMMEGVPQAMGEEGIMGGIMGGAVASALGRSPQAPAAPAPPVAEEPPAPPPPESFEQVFGPEGQVVDTSGTAENLSALQGRGGVLSPEERDFVAASAPPPGVAPATESVGMREFQGQQRLPLTTSQELAEIGSAYDQGRAVKIPGREVEPVRPPPGTQSEMRYEGRRRGGYYPLPDVEGRAPTPVPSQQPPLDEDGQVQPEEVIPQPSDVEQVQARTGDLFTGTTPNVRTRAQALKERREQQKRTRKESRIIRPATRGIGGFRVEDDGNVSEFDTFEEADTAYQKLVDRGRRPKLTPIRTVSPQVARTDVVVEPAKPAAPRLAAIREAEETEAATEAATEAESTEFVAPAKTRTKTAARALGQAVQSAKGERAKRVRGFFPPKALDFPDQASHDRYTKEFSKLVDAELTMEMLGNERQTRRSRAVLKAASEASIAARKNLARIRTLSQPKRKSERMVRVAERLSPNIGKGIRDEEARDDKEDENADETGLPEDVDPEELRKLDPAKVDELSGDELERLFVDAAMIQAGKTAAVELAYRMPREAADVGARSLSDEAATDLLTRDRISSADQIAEGAEPVALHTPKPIQNKLGKVSEATLADFKRAAGKDRWKYRITQKGAPDTTGVVRGETEAEARGFVDRWIQKHNRGMGDSTLRGSTFKELLDAHRAPSMRKRLIKRVISYLRNRETTVEEAASVAADVTLTETVEGTQRAEIPGAKTVRGKRVYDEGAVFDTGVLTEDYLPQDESAAKRDLRLKRAEGSRSELEGAVAAADASVDKFAKSELANSVDNVTGDMTSGATRFRVARMYYRSIMDYGRALLRSDINTAAAIRQMEKVSKFLKDAAALPAEAFTSRLSALARAESRESILRKSVGKDAGLRDLKASLANPETRAVTMVKHNARIRQATAAFMRRTNVWKQNDLYNTVVGPLMTKFADSSWRDGFPTYRPTRLELDGLKWALDQWQADPKTKEPLYEPVRRFFAELGFEFDANGSLNVPQTEAEALPYYLKQYDLFAPITAMEHVPATDVMLVKKYQKRFGDEREFKPPPESRLSKTSQLTVQRRAEEDALARAERAADEKFDHEQAVQIGKALQINRVIEAFRAKIKEPKLTVEGMIRQEQRLLRALDELGVLQRSAETPAFVTVDNPENPNKRIRIRLVGTALEAKKITKEQARKTMLTVRKFSIPNPPKEATKLAEARLKNEIGQENNFFLKEVAPSRHGDAFTAASAKLRTELVKPTTGHKLLDHIIESVPVEHVYSKLARRLRRLNVSNVPTRWGTFSSDSLGRMKPDGSLIILNRNALQEVTAKHGNDHGDAALIHAILHELVHSATVYALRNDRGVRSAFLQMRTIAAREFRQAGIPMPYGMKFGNPVEEFVAEAFSNTAFQELLKGVRVGKDSMWKQLIRFMRQLLGMNNAEFDNVLDVVMATADRVFVDAAPTPRRKDQFFNLENIDDPVAKKYLSIGGTLFDLPKAQQAIKQRGLYSLTSAPLSLMTLPQIRGAFADKLKGLEEYYREFKRRDATSAQALEPAERLSREWTKLTEQAQKSQKQTATEFSYLATDASVFNMHPDVPVTDEKNDHITLDEQKKKHAELRARFEALPQEWKDHWHALQKYYADTLERESVLLTENALRATLTKGANAMSLESFERRYPREKIAALTTKEKLAEEFKGMLDDEMLTTVSAIRSLPRQRTGPYFPIMRYGEFVAEAKKVHPPRSFNTPKEARTWAAEERAKDPTLEISIDDEKSTATVTERTFLLAESPEEAILKRAELVDEYGDAATIPAVTRKVDFDQTSTIESNSGLGRILNQLAGNLGAQSAIKQYYLRTLADSSFRKHEIKRKNRKGYDGRLQHRNFNNYAQAASYYSAQLEHGWRMADAMRTMYDDMKSTEGAGFEGIRKSDVYKQIELRDRMTSDFKQVSKFVRKGTGLAQFFLLTSPSYSMVNATQPYMVSLPYMAARHGYGESITAMIAAQKAIIHPLVGQAWNSKAGLAAFWSRTKTEQAFNVLDEVKESIKNRIAPDKAKELLDMLDALRRESILDLSWSAEMRDIAEGTETGVTQKIIDASRIMSHLTEVNNRILTAIASYNLARAKGSQEEAIEYAKEVVGQTHFDYSSGSTPLLFRPDGPLGQMAPLVFQFMKYPQHMYALLISNMVKVFKASGTEKKEAARIIGGLLGTHMLAGGIIGMSLQPIKWAMGLAMMALGDDDEAYTFTGAMNGETFDRYVQEGIANVAGPGVAELLARGVPASFGTDMSSRMSLGTLYFMDLKPETAESTIGSMVLSMGGPWLSIGENGIRGMADMMNGDYARGVERVAPKAVRDVFKTYRYAAEGLVNSAGDTVIEGKDIPPLELFLQSLGFSSGTVGDFYNRQSAIKDKERYGIDRREALIERYIKAARDPNERADVLQEIAAFSRANPAVRITRSTLVKAVQNQKMREASYKRHGANLRGKAAVRSYADEGWYYQ